MSDTLTLAELERHLWKSADILRGSIDAADYKHYIFGLLFYKRLCDVWQEEYDQRMAEFGDETLAGMPEEHRFHVRPKSQTNATAPKRSFWACICTRPSPTRFSSASRARRPKRTAKHLCQFRPTGEGYLDKYGIDEALPADAVGPL